MITKVFKISSKHLFKVCDKYIFFPSNILIRMIKYMRRKKGSCPTSRRQEPDNSMLNYNMNELIV